MNTQHPWPVIDRPRNEVAEILKAYGTSLQNQYPELEGRLTITHREDSPMYILSFYILNHKLRGYNTRILSVEQPIDRSFPVDLTMHYKTYSSAPKHLDADAFEPALRRELASEPIQNILNNLLALGNTMEEYRSDISQSSANP
jgi:hypothetical protein